MADAGVASVITAWGRLGYPRRARRLWESAVIISRDGWPAVVPQGLILSVVTVALMLIGGVVAGFAARRPAPDVREREYAA